MRRLKIIVADLLETRAKLAEQRPPREHAVHARHRRRIADARQF
jgi:hypothetical protein